MVCSILITPTLSPLGVEPEPGAAVVTHDVTPGGQDLVTRVSCDISQSEAGATLH